jgi:hypothetical protein
MQVTLFYHMQPEDMVVSLTIRHFPQPSALSLAAAATLSALSV